MSKWQFWIDRGGTFTDEIAQRPDEEILVHKLWSDCRKTSSSNSDRSQDSPDFCTEIGAILELL
jgi:5-oxoprolinase (ATP-hydrolysing)